MDPEFRRAVIIVLSVGLSIVSIGAGLIYFAYRSFGAERKGATRPVALVAAALAFVAVCCLALLALALRR
ncbi:MAG TPA: hypothetical protein VFL80_07975 [Thermoanaerobaculia bacterium]|nr:hypothetical protein [Thermoanaerobaculia bacterium]